jgi:hypothetical protein
VICEGGECVMIEEESVICEGGMCDV